MSDSMSERVEHANERKFFVHDVTILLPMIQVCGIPPRPARPLAGWFRMRGPGEGFAWRGRVGQHFPQLRP